MSEGQFSACGSSAREPQCCFGRPPPTVTSSSLPPSHHVLRPPPQKWHSGFFFRRATSPSNWREALEWGRTNGGRGELATAKPVGRSAGPCMQAAAAAVLWAAAAVQIFIKGSLTPSVRPPSLSDLRIYSGGPTDRPTDRPTTCGSAGGGRESSEGRWLTLWRRQGSPLEPPSLYSGIPANVARGRQPHGKRVVQPHSQFPLLREKCLAFPASS